ncbi:MAG: hybrid sensor histidine kinase/response regulator [Chloroflexota bacterium]
MPDKQTILYIDSDPISRLLVDRTLRYAGFKVLTAERGLDGIDIARSESLQLILTDIDLPDITGRELTTVLRSDERFTKVPIVALTDLGYGEQRDLAMAAGLTGYITKPLDVEGLPSQLEYYLGGGRDKIDRERLSAARTRYTREIVSQLENRVRELEIKNKDLVQLDQLKDTFLQITAHELRTPLTLVYGYSRLLQENTHIEAAVEADPATGTLLAGLVEAIERMQGIINEILTMSRVMTDKVDLSIGPISVKQIVEHVIAHYASALEERTLGLTFDERNIPRTMRGDAEMLRIVLDNLVSNAIKYTPDGGTIHIDGHVDDTFLHLSVTDTGIGIDPDDFDLIFDRFHTASDPQLHSTSKTAFAGGGIGLGLAICKGVVEAHGGTITVQSTGRDPDELPGSTFTIQLPLDGVAHTSVSEQPASS